MKDKDRPVVVPSKAGGTRRNQEVQTAMAERDDEDATTRLDRDLAAARKKVEAKRAGGSSPAATKNAAAKDDEPDVPRSQRKPRLSDDERAERDRKLSEERAQRKTEKAAERQRKREEKAALRQTPHLSKVRKAQEQLPELTKEARGMYETLVAGLPPSDINALGLHLQHFYRHHVTEAASKRELALGQKVRLLGGGAKYVGKVGVVTRLQRIRCYVKVEGIGTPAYVFTSETEDAPAE